MSYKEAPMRMLYVSHFQPQQEAAFCRSNRRLNVGIKYGSAVKVAGVSKKVRLKVGAVMQCVYGNGERLSLTTCHTKTLVNDFFAPN